MKKTKRTRHPWTWSCIVLDCSRCAADRKKPTNLDPAAWAAYNAWLAAQPLEKEET